jgi:hypothetical protein
MIDKIPPALISPDLIKVEAIPKKVVYDFTKKSTNYKMLEEGIYDRFDCEERCDSKIKPEDLKKLEIELKKKQKRRIKRESRSGSMARRSRQPRGEDEEAGEPIYDEHGNQIRPGDR